MTKDITVTVSKEAHELGEGIAKFHAAVKQALADGWQAGQDVPAVIQSAVVDLVPAMQGADQVSSEAVDKEHFANALYLGLSPIAFSYIK